MRLIDADALIKAVCVSRCGKEPNKCSIFKEHSMHCIYVNLINNSPVVDAVPVVRCSECKHYKSVLCPLSMADGYYWPAHNPDFFCADGERREEHADQR